MTLSLLPFKQNFLWGPPPLTSKTSHKSEISISSDRTWISLWGSGPCGQMPWMQPSDFPISGSTHLVERRNSQVVRLLGSLNWLMSRSLSKAGVLPSSPRTEGNKQEMDRWGQGYTEKSTGKWIFKAKQDNKHYSAQIPCSGHSVGTYHETQASINCVSPFSTLGQI